MPEFAAAGTAVHSILPGIPACSLERKNYTKHIIFSQSHYCLNHDTADANISLKNL